jgi:hypothetical protein
MEQDEKILLLQLILEDIRGNWAFEMADRRAEALMLSRDLRDAGVKDMGKLSLHIEDYVTGEDGRYFRMDYPNGYRGMEKLHGLTRIAEERSKEFLIQVLRVLTCPEDALDYNAPGSE